MARYLNPGIAEFQEAPGGDLGLRGGNGGRTHQLIEAAHNRSANQSHHIEAGLSYAVQQAYYSAQDYCTIIPELDTGKGYADLAHYQGNLILIGISYDQTV